MQLGATLPWQETLLQLVLLVSSAVLEPCLTFDPGEGSDPKGSPGGLWCKNKITENAAEERNLCMHSQLPITALGHSWDLCQVTNQRQNSNLDLCETHGWATPQESLGTF